MLLLPLLPLPPRLCPPLFVFTSSVRLCSPVFTLPHPRSRPPLLLAPALVCVRSCRSRCWCRRCSPPFSFVFAAVAAAAGVAVARPRSRLCSQLSLPLLVSPLLAPVLVRVRSCRCRCWCRRCSPPLSFVFTAVAVAVARPRSHPTLICVHPSCPPLFTFVHTPSFAFAPPARSRPPAFVRVCGCSCWCWCWCRSCSLTFVRTYPPSFMFAAITAAAAGAAVSPALVCVRGCNCRRAAAAVVPAVCCWHSLFVSASNAELVHTIILKNSPLFHRLPT
jgi:hypothetical protein